MYLNFFIPLSIFSSLSFLSKNINDITLGILTYNKIQDMKIEKFKILSALFLRNSDIIFKKDIISSLFKGKIPEIDSAFPFRKSIPLFLGHPKNIQHRKETIKQHLQNVNIKFLILHQHDEYLLPDKHIFG